mmetsp:Transcript_22723/g.46244  ORF Transcript_22723/g.46244 Transcript_22723/m.46244 type:complete len:599 (+) Transcript_22723:765-2561(+)
MPLPLSFVSGSNLSVSSDDEDSADADDILAILRGDSSDARDNSGEVRSPLHGESAPSNNSITNTSSATVRHTSRNDIISFGKDAGSDMRKAVSFDIDHTDNDKVSALSSYGSANISGSTTARGSLSGGKVSRPTSRESMSSERENSRFHEISRNHDRLNNHETLSAKNMRKIEMEHPGESLDFDTKVNERKTAAYPSGEFPNPTTQSNEITHGLMSNLSLEIGTLKNELQQMIATQKTENQRLNEYFAKRDEILKQCWSDISTKVNDSSKKMVEETMSYKKIISDSYCDVINHVISSQNEMKTICCGIEQLVRTLLTDKQSAQDKISKIIEELLLKVNSNHVRLEAITTDLKKMTEHVKLGNTSEREHLVQLKLSMEREYQKQNQQIRDEKTNLADRWAAYESDASTIRHKENALRIERQHLSDERIKIEEERRHLQQSEALFEQQKNASSEEIQYAENMIVRFHDAENRVKMEMENLAQLSEFVVRKDAEAEQKLDVAEEMVNYLQGLESTVKCDKENSDKNLEQLRRDRQHFVEERVAFLKEKSKVNELRHSKKQTSFVQRFENPNSKEEGSFVAKLPLQDLLARVENDLNRLKTS